MIKYELTPGGSGTGIHHYQSILDCPRAAMLKLADRDIPNPLQYNHNKQWVVGTIAHAFMDLHYSELLPLDVDPSEVEFNYVIHPLARQKAERMFNWWRDAHPELDILGEGFATEYSLPRDEPEMQAEIEESVGVAPFTCAIDYATKLRAVHISRLQREFNISGRSTALEPGHWIVDYKFFGQTSKVNVDMALTSMQYTAYPLAFQAAQPDLECKGAIQVTFICTKEPSVSLIVVPFPNEEKVKVLHSMLNICKEELTHSPQRCDPTKCVTKTWGGTICGYYVMGQCRRY